MSVNDWARLLFILGGAFAVLGPALAVVRAISRYKRDAPIAGSWDYFDAQNDRENMLRVMRRDAWARAGELVSVGVGVALSAVASIMLIS